MLWKFIQRVFKKPSYEDGYNQAITDALKRPLEDLWDEYERCVFDHDEYDSGYRHGLHSLRDYNAPHHDRSGDFWGLPAR